MKAARVVYILVVVLIELVLAFDEAPLCASEVAGRSEGDFRLLAGNRWAGLTDGLKAATAAGFGVYPAALSIAHGSPDTVGVVCLDYAGHLVYRWQKGTGDWQEQEVDTGRSWFPWVWKVFLTYDEGANPRILVIGTVATGEVTPSAMVTQYHQQEEGGPLSATVVHQGSGYYSSTVDWAQCSADAKGTIYVVIPSAFERRATKGDETSGRCVVLGCLTRRGEWHERTDKDLYWADIASTGGEGVYCVARTNQQDTFRVGRLTESLALDDLRPMLIENGPRGLWRIMSPSRSIWGYQDTLGIRYAIWRERNKKWIRQNFEILSPGLPPAWSGEAYLFPRGPDGWTLVVSRAYAEGVLQEEQPTCLLYARGLGSSIDKVRVVSRGQFRQLAVLRDQKGCYYAACVDLDGPALRYFKFLPDDGRPGKGN